MALTEPGAGSDVGALRTTAQIISYELPMALALVSLVVVTGTLKMSGIVEYQKALPLIVLGPPGGRLAQVHGPFRIATIGLSLADLAADVERARPTPAPTPRRTGK